MPERGSSTSSDCGAKTEAVFFLGFCGGGLGPDEEEEDEEEAVGYGTVIVPSCGTKVSSSGAFLEGGSGQGCGLFAGFLDVAASGVSLCLLGAKSLLMALSSSMAVACGPIGKGRFITPSAGGPKVSSSSGCS